MALFAGAALADQQASTLNTAMNCSLIAATVYAELSTETAESVAHLSQIKCEDQWNAAEAASVNAAIEDVEKKLGRKLTDEELAQMDRKPVYSKLAADEIAIRVANWRVQSVAAGSPIYKALREKYLRQKLDLQGAAKLDN